MGGLFDHYLGSYRPWLKRKGAMTRFLLSQLYLRSCRLDINSDSMTVRLSKMISGL
jgi:hypothetical protein